MFTKPYSEETSRIIDEEVGKLIDGAYHRAKDILHSNFEKLSALADSLLKNEVIFREDVERILGERPFKKLEAPSATPASLAIDAPHSESAEAESPAADASSEKSEGDTPASE